MWSYYGAKTNVAKFYPKPKHRLIIEPFAGTARYALQHFENDVILNDKYDVISRIWVWLQKCSEGDILKLLRLKAGESLDDYQFDCEEAKLLMGFLVGYGLEKPRVTATAKQMHRPNFINFSLKRIASSLFKIRHWKIYNIDFSELQNQTATWFIDPPYQFGGHCYPMSSRFIDFNFLATWCRERNGQIIVCESMKATWLDFKPMVLHKGRTGMQHEGIWTNEATAFDNIQLKLIA